MVQPFYEGVHPFAGGLAAVKLADDPYKRITNADALVTITEWDQFQTFDLKRIHAALNEPIIVNLCKGDIERSVAFALWASSTVSA